MESILIPKTIKSATQLRDWVNENGTIAFEHGFKANIKFQGNNVRMSMIERNGVHIYNPTTKQQKTIPFINFNPKTIDKIISECNRYYDYVLKEA